MKFSVHRNPLLEALNKIQSVVEKKNTVPILSNILFSVDGQELSICATDLEVGMKMKIAVKGQVDGKITLSAKAFLDIVKELPQAELELTRKENDWVEIVSGKSRFKVVSLAATEYPNLPSFEDKRYLDARVDALKEMIERTSFAVSTDATRYLMNGVYLENLEKNVMRMTATDGHRLAFMDSELFSEAPEMKRGLIIPKKGLNELNKLLQESDRSVGVAFERGYIFAHANQTYLFIRLIEGEFPDYRQVIPRATDKLLKVDREAFLSALKRVSLLAHEKSKGVKFSIQDQLLTIYSSNPDLGEAKEEIDIDYSGEALSIGFNAKYLLECLEVTPTKTLELHLKDHLSPGILRGEGQPNHTYVIMPMRI
jgi:DNA polymerase III subunit beta